MPKCYWCGGTLRKYQRRQREPIYGPQKYICTNCGRRQ